ncbi:Psp operon transcriptional activator [Klebsiella variicola]|nr:Psp operon transcriptional activator [Klebsiella variicola]
MASWSAWAAASRCRSNVRLVCATNADLPRMVEEGHFRADLLDRLAFDVVQLPPLRERQSDIMLLANQFAIQMCRELGLPLFPGFSERAHRNAARLPLAREYS